MELMLSTSFLLITCSSSFIFRYLILWFLVFTKLWRFSSHPAERDWSHPLLIFNFLKQYSAHWSCLTAMKCMYQRIFNKKRRNTWSKNIISIWLAWKNWIFSDSYRNSPFLLKCPLQEKKLWFSWHGNHVTYSYLSFDYKLSALPLLIGLVANYIGSIFSKSLQSVFPLFVGYVCTVVAVFCCCLCTCLWSLKPLLFFVLTELALPRCCLCPVVSKGFWWKFSQGGFPAAWLIQRCCACWHFIRKYSWFVIHRQKKHCFEDDESNRHISSECLRSIMLHGNKMLRDVNCVTSGRTPRDIFINR